MELKSIPTKQILANFYQPRTKFDKEKTKELAESILSNGLIQPIVVRTWKGNRFMIVAGERRWRAHNLAKIKTIPAIVKSYKSTGQFMVESLIENIHREDLSDSEKAKFLKRIMKEEKLKNTTELSNRIKIPRRNIDVWFDAYGLRKELVGPAKKVSQSVIQETSSLPKEKRIELIKQAVTEDFGSREMRKRVSEIKEESKPEPVKFERVADDIGNELLSVFHSFENHTTELLKDNLKDLSKGVANQLMTTAGLHMKHFMKLVNVLRQRGARPNKLILELVRANNGKV